ncbi:15-hydroxyprostaglandin dehydrogenase [Trichonephila clavipes]|nr:15-hydroxyprostaglandin dehydrogenase [Trichonephila clavipes]
MDWPARSPDLNPIQHVWDFLGRRLAARTLPPITIRELRLALQDEWAAMPQQLIDTLILSMGRRCETCLAVCIANIQEEKAKEFMKEQEPVYGQENIIAVLCDVTKESDFEKAFDLTLEKFHRVDVLVNNAGILNEYEPQKVIDVNLVGTIFGCRAALNYMGKSNGGKGGFVVNIASIAGLLPESALPVYAASKHGIVGLTRSYGRPYHFKKEGVTFAALCPSFINTDLLRTAVTLIKGADFTKRTDLMSPEYVAKAVLKLLEDKINGSTLIVTLDGYNYIDVPEELKAFIDVPVAIVTGGAQGLGAAICIELLKQGYKVCVADIQEYKGKHFVHQQEEEFGSENVIFSAL